MVTCYTGGSILNRVVLKLLLSLMVPKSKMNKSKFRSTQNVIFWQSLDAIRKLKRKKSRQGEDIKDGDRGCRHTSVVKMTK